MLIPPSSILRAEPPPDNVVVVIRGGEHSLDDAVLDRAVGDCWDAHGFFGMSVFADPAGNDIGELASRTPLSAVGSFALHWSGGSAKRASR